MTHLYYSRLSGRIAAITFLCFLLVSVSSSYAKPVTEPEIVSDDLDISINKYPAAGKQLILWIAPSFGFRHGHNVLSQQLSTNGYEVWQADINEALFLPHNSTAMRELNAKYVADLIEIAHNKTHKEVILVSGSYGAIPVLRGARQWLGRKPSDKYVLGIVLFSPNVYQNIPPLGTEPQYLPIAYATNIPVIIYQGSMNSNRWQVEKLATILRSGGSFVKVEMMPNIVGLFYQEEIEPDIDDYYRQFARNFSQQIKLLKQNPYSLQATPIKSTEGTSGTGLDSRIKKFMGNAKPPAIELRDINNKPYKITNYRNQVTVVNFWATWCTPCIKEIPSLNNLRSAMVDQPFQLISINYAEKATTIRDFMKMVKVDFPVLLDEQGLVSAQWKVIAFPSTFVIGKDGLIYYGVNAGIEWDTPEVLGILNKMLKNVQP